jgi:hypothetical protein
MTELTVYAKGYKIDVEEDSVEVSLNGRVMRTFCGEAENGLQKALDFVLDPRVFSVKGYKYRGTIHSAWARMIKHRDGYVCRKCGGGDVEAHHILPVSKGGGYEMDNGITLCVSCHHKEHQ